MSSLVIQVADFGSELQKQSIELRREILRKPLNLDFSLQELSEEYNQVHIVASIDSVVVACLLLVIVDKKTIKMRQVAVTTHSQGQGIGTRMVSFCEEWCIKKGYCRITLNARENAIRFYQELSYQKEVAPFLEVGIPHIKMIKDWCAG